MKIKNLNRLTLCYAKKIYNITIALLSVLSIIIIFMDLGSVISISKNPYKIIDFAILIIFEVDYIVRFILAKNKQSFFKENIFDLIAIIPFNSVFSLFRISRLLRLAKITKLLRLTRAVGFWGVLKKKINRFLHTNGFIYALYYSAGLIFVSSILIMYIEKQSFFDALWWSIVTCTTVGYGDISPSTGAGRIIAVILMLSGIGLIGMLTGTITTYFTSNKNETTNEDLNKIISNMSDDEKEKLYQIAKIIKR